MPTQIFDLPCPGPASLIPPPPQRRRLMIKFYYHPSPNPAKVALFLEGACLPYELMPVDTRTGAQFKPGFVKVNPNSKTPALADRAPTVFDTNALRPYCA